MFLNTEKWSLISVLWCGIVSEAGARCSPKSSISVINLPFFKESTLPQVVFNFVVSGSVVYFCLDDAPEKMMVCLRNKERFSPA